MKLKKLIKEKKKMVKKFVDKKILIGKKDEIIRKILGNGNVNGNVGEKNFINKWI